MVCDVTLSRLAAAAGAHGYMLASPARANSAALAPARPTLYVYDHCPFCVRARLAFGLKGIKYDTRFMANDDVDLPTALVGKKISPIFDDGKGTKPYAESLDIVRNVDKDPAYGPVNMFKPLSDRTDLKEIGRASCRERV